MSKPIKKESDILDSMDTTEEKEETVLLVPDYRKLRKNRMKVAQPEDAMALQKELIEIGYQAPAVLAIMMANEAFDNMEFARDNFGVISKEYEVHHKLANTAISSALPYFASRIKTGTELSDIVMSENIGAAIGSLLTKLGN